MIPESNDHTRPNTSAPVSPQSYNSDRSLYSTKNAGARNLAIASLILPILCIAKPWLLFLALPVSTLISFAALAHAKKNMSDERFPRLATKVNVAMLMLAGIGFLFIVSGFVGWLL